MWIIYPLYVHFFIIAVPERALPEDTKLLAIILVVVVLVAREPN